MRRAGFREELSTSFSRLKRVLACEAHANPSRIRVDVQLSQTDTHDSHAERSLLAGVQICFAPTTCAPIRRSLIRVIEIASATGATASWRRKGQTRIMADAIVNDSGLPDRVSPWAQQIAVQALPEETLLFLLEVDIAKPTGCRSPLGHCSPNRLLVGGACRPFATLSTATSRSATNSRTR